ncbi:hypothetical protein [Shewanella psychrotolerans]|uniref:hypothetical protein n=1 Tax=Shewanella psychrotolerans TaxID=2864206 RepID=UPI001C65F76D|nr:hypothetical protein [Shewanella psychrotolerans]QYK00195.1 hypothetical protein K0I62_12240 [Shewanella psychrotolerans]
MPIKNVVLLFLLANLTTACAGSKPDVDDFTIKVEDRFQTSIKGDGIKLFTYKVKYAHLPTLEQPHMARVRKLERKKRASNNLSQWTQQIELGLDKTINMTGYCREGYIELSRIVEVGRGEIRGECNDGASKDDIKKFAS